MAQAVEAFAFDRHVADRPHQQHIRTLVAEGEVVGGAFGQHTRRKWTKALPKLDLEVDPALDLAATRIGQDAAGTERTRPKLHPPLKPADHLLLGQQLGHTIRQRVGADVLAR